MAFIARPSYGVPVLARDLAEPMAAERAEATRLGMRPLRKGVAPTVDGRWQMDFVVNADECVALIAGVTGIVGIYRLDLEDRRGVKLATLPRGASSHVAQVQWCARAATGVRATLSHFGDRAALVPEVHWELASGGRGPGLDERRLTRNEIVDVRSREELDRRDEAEAVAAFEARARAVELELVPDATRRSPPLRVDERSAVLLPPEPATFLALERALMTRDATPTLAPYFEPVPEWLAVPGAVPAVQGTESVSLLRVEGGWERVLAATDLAALAAGGCVALTFARLEDPAPDAQVVRVEIPSMARQPLAGRDGVWSDRVCPAEGLYLYAIPAAAAAPYEVGIHAIPGASRVRAGSRRSTYGGELLPSAERTSLEQGCRSPDAAGSVQACAALARALERDGAPERDVDAAFERACGRGSAEACGQLSERWLASLDFGHHDRAIELERTACDGSDWTSCARRATRLRAAPDPTAGLAEARRLYGLACSEGHLAAACANLREMERLSLGVR